jgi:two-component system sensor histidine kinase GlrK
MDEASRKYGIIGTMKTGFDFRYPKSFFRLLLIAFTAVSLPLILAFVSAAVHVERLAEQGQTVVAQAAQSARGSRLLNEQVTMLERTVRQFLILGDAALLNDYQRLRQRFKATTSELSLLPLDESQLQELNRTIDKEQSLFERLGRQAPGDPPRPAETRALIEGYIELSELARSMLDISNALIDREVEQLRTTAGKAQAILWWQLFATVPAGLLLAVGVTVLIARPIRQLDSAIRALGDGVFDRRIRVNGPADLVYLGDRLEWLRQRLVELEDQKQRFLRHVSHELKTPLTSLREGSHLLADGTAGSLTPAQRDVVAILQRQSGELQRMIEDLLNYQRAQDGLTRLALAEVDCERIVAKVADDHRLAAEARGVRMALDLQPVRLKADAEKLRVVVDNLVSNAVKYSPDAGQVSLTLRAEGGQALLEVCDQGPGISAAERERVFDWFFQGERPHHGRVEGSGLGLAIARDLVLAHHGSITLLEAAAGAHFRVSLPLAVS